MKLLWVPVLFLPALGWSVDLRFQYLNGDQFSYIGNSEQSVFLNSKPVQANTNTFRSSYSVSTDDGSARLSISTTFDTQSKGPHAYSQASDSNQMEYSVNDRGIFSVSEGSKFPVVRNVPTFPDKPLTEGQTWSEPAAEVIDPSGINIFSQNKTSLAAITLTFPVSYTYRGSERKDDKTLDVVEAEYAIFYRPELGGQGYRVYPVLISGKTRQTVYFDNALGLEDAYQEEYVLDLVLSNGDIYEFVGNSDAKLQPSGLTERPAAVAETPGPASMEAGPKETPDIAETTDATGTALEPVAVEPSPPARIKPTFDTIAFPPNTAALTEEAKAQLRGVADVLKDWQGDVLIEGYAADVGDVSQQKILSEKRAAAVGDYLVGLGVRTADQIILSGLGSRRAVAPNDSVESRARNRRALILLLDENPVGSTVSSPSEP